MILGVDVGGTFTDATLLTDDRLVTAKSPTTPADQSLGVMAAVAEALDRHYFAKPVRTLFNDVRHYFPMTEQLRVYRMCEKHMLLATEYVDSQLREGVTFDGSPVCCHASTRKGTACQRVPLPGSKYCPSHKHLEDEFDVVAAA